MKQTNSTDAHAVSQSLAFKGIPASQFKITSNGRLECRYITNQTDFWAQPSAVAYGYMSNDAAVDMAKHLLITLTDKKT